LSRAASLNPSSPLLSPTLNPLRQALNHPCVPRGKPASEDSLNTAQSSHTGLLLLRGVKALKRVSLLLSVFGLGFKVVALCRTTVGRRGQGQSLSLTSTHN
jgi:hypothetical protein